MLHRDQQHLPQRSHTPTTITRCTKLSLWCQLALLLPVLTLVLFALNKNNLQQLSQSLYTGNNATGALLLCFLLYVLPVTTHAEEPIEADTQTDAELDELVGDPLAADAMPELDIAPPMTTHAEQEPVEKNSTPDAKLDEVVGDPLAADAMPEYDAPPPNPCDRTRDSLEYDPSWYDSSHAVMNTVFCEPALWFDSFYGSDRVLEETGGTYVRWRNDIIQTEGQGTRFRTNLNFSVELPKISQRLQLTFEGDQDQELQDVLPGVQAEDPGNTLGLRLDVKDTARSRFNISVSGKPRVRARYRYTYPLPYDSLIRFTQEVQNEEGVNGARTRLDFEKAFLPVKLFRSTTEGFIAEDFKGVDWSQAFSLFQRLSKKSSVSYETGIVGITEPESLVTNYRLGIRYRQNIHRDWLFFEITPDISWPVELSEDRETVVNDRHSVMSIIIRLEIHFGNTRTRKYSDYIY